MTDFAAARRMMVDSQIRTSDVTDPRIIAAMLELPRERFVPQTKADLAYLDFDAPVTEAAHGKPARRLLKPMVLAKLVQAAALQASDHVLAPDALCRQLKAGGRFVAVVGRAPTAQAMLYRSVGGDVSAWPIFDAAAPVLPGFAAPPAFVF